MTDIPVRQRQRADFLVRLLDLPDASRLAKAMGIKDHGFVQRLRTNLQQRASIADAPRPGRQRKYTPELLQRAQDYMLTEIDCAWSMQAIVGSMVEAGILEEGTNAESFWAVFAPYMREQGLRLVYGARRLTFAMSSSHASLRLAWCQETQTVITPATVGDYWFVDEILLMYGPPPGGER